MNKIVIITDSTSDLTKAEYEEIGADMVSLRVHFKDKSFIDRKTIDATKLYELVGKYKILPKTSAPTVEDIVKVFKAHLDKGEDIIFSGISSEFSSCFNDAQVAATYFSDEEQKRIRFLDSRSLSSGIGLVLYTLYRSIQAGKNLDQVLEDGKDVVDRVNAEFVVDTMEYLYKGGRCSGVAYFAGSLLKLHPVIRVEHGKMIVHKITHGRTVKGVDFQLDEFKKQFDNNNVVMDKIFITSSLGGDMIEYMDKKVKEIVGKQFEKCISITDAGSVISSHCGRGTIGLLYITKNVVIE